MFIRSGVYKVVFTRSFTAIAGADSPKRPLKPFGVPFTQTPSHINKHEEAQPSTESSNDRFSAMFDDGNCWQ